MGNKSTSGVDEPSFSFGKSKRKYHYAKFFQHREEAISQLCPENPGVGHYSTVNLDKI